MIMSGEEVKKILKENYKLADVAAAMGIIPQNLQSLLDVADIKTGVLERIAAAIGKDICFFFKTAGTYLALGPHSIAGNNITSSDNHTNINVTLPEQGFQKIIKSDGTQTTMEVATTSGEYAIPREIADRLSALQRENGDLKNKIIELQERLLSCK